MTAVENLMNRISIVIPSLRGWCTQEKAKELAEVCLREEPEIIVELGVFGGRSLFPMSMAAEVNGKGVVFGIDPWKSEASLEGVKEEANQEYWQKVPHEEVYREFLKSILDHHQSQYVIPLRMKSEQAVKLFANESIGCLHADGNHAEEISSNEVKLWMPKLKRGGIWIGDDLAWASTKKAFALVRKSCSTLVERENYGIYKKK